VPAEGHAVIYIAQPARAQPVEGALRHLPGEGGDEGIFGLIQCPGPFALGPLQPLDPALNLDAPNGLPVPDLVIDPGGGGRVAARFRLWWLSGAETKTRASVSSLA